MPYVFKYRMYRHTAKKIRSQEFCYKCKIPTETQTGLIITASRGGLLPYILFRTHNISSLRFCLFFSSRNSLQWLSRLGGGSVDGWSHIGWGSLGPCFSTSPLISWCLNVKRVSSFVSWHRLVNHHRVTTRKHSVFSLNSTYNFKQVFDYTRCNCIIWSFSSPPSIWMFQS